MDKKSFILFKDYSDKFNTLSFEQIGKLFTMIFEYENTLSILDFDDPVIKMCFNFIKSDLDRNHEKYNKMCKRNQSNGLKGGRPKNPKHPKKPTGLNGNPEEPKKPDTDTDTDTDTENDNVKLKDVSAYFLQTVKKEFPTIPIDELKVETEAKLYFSTRTENKWIKANKKKVKNWKLDCRQWILSKGYSKFKDYKPNDPKQNISA